MTRSRVRIVALLALGAAMLAGCGRGPIEGVDAASARAGPGDSMLSMFRTDAGIMAVDLGWWGAANQLRRQLLELGAEPADVVAVFLTHAHRDHIAAWPMVSGATFYLAAAEAPYFFGEAEYDGWIPRAADRIVLPTLPERGEIEVVTFATDTVIVVGQDTVRAFLVPGHTPGSTAYLVRGILFAGDAVSHTILGFRHAAPGFSDDVDLSAESLRDLLDRVAGYDVRWVCTAHANCAEFDEAFRREALGGPAVQLIPQWGSRDRPDRGPDT